MSESVRSPQIVPVEYAPFPLTRDGKRAPRADDGPRGLPGLKRRRLLVWSWAFARQKMALGLRPLVLLLGWLDGFGRPLSLRLWRVLYAAGALTAEAAGLLRVTAVGLAGRLETLRHKCLHVSGRRLRKRLTLACLFSGICLCLIVNSFYTLGLEVFLNGQSIGFVSSPSEFARAVDDVSLRASEILNFPHYPNPDVSYRYAVVDRTSIFDRAEVEERLFGQIANIQKLDVLTVDGVIVAVTSDRSGLETVLNGLLEAHDMNGAADSVTFVQEVSLTNQWTDIALERPLSEITAVLSAVSEARYDEINTQNTWEEIARRNGMSQEDLRALNGFSAPDIYDGQGGIDGQDAADDPDIETIQRVLVQKAEPYLTVVASVNTQYQEEIPYTTVTVSDDTIYEGDQKIRVSGLPGVARVSAQLRYRNGEIYESLEVGRETVLEPVEEVIAEGVKKRPPKSPTGAFIRPYWGKLTSKFGYRSLFGGSMHQGIDLAGPTGSPIVASDGGTVTFAGWRNGYGNCVTIRHANGYSTLYGHCSKMLVKEGQAVAKGELIAKVGSTGRSTGSHLHFEIRINGTPVDPLKHIN